MEFAEENPLPNCDENISPYLGSPTYPKYVELISAQSETALLDGYGNAEERPKAASNGYTKKGEIYLIVKSSFFYSLFWNPLRENLGFGQSPMYSIIFTHK